MKKLNLFLVLVLSVVFISCQKDEITVTLNQSGTVEVKVIDGNNQGVSDVLVEIANGYFVAFEGKTDNNGICKSEKLLQGYYTCSVEAVIGKAIYSDSKNLQIIADENKKIELNPITNSGNVTINVYDYYTDRPLNKVLSVALVPYRTSYEVSVASIQSAAHFVLTTNVNGEVTFPNIPARTDYQVFIFDSNGLYSTYYYNTVFVEKGQTRTYMVEVRN